MQNAAPPARYDLPWKAAITHALRAFMAFFFADLCAQIDWSKRPRFRDKELARIGFGDAPNAMVADKLVEVHQRGGGTRWLLIHIEVQSQRDTSLAWRMLNYHLRILNEYQHPVASLVLLADEDPDWRPRLFHADTLGTTLDFAFSTAKLLDYARQPDVLLASDNPFALVTLAHFRSQRARHDADQLYAAKWQLTKLLYQHRWSKPRIIALFKVINWMMALPERHQERYWQALQSLERERKMEWITPLEQSFMDKGWEKGLKQGRKEGLEEGLEKGLEQGLEKGLAQGRVAGLEQGRKEGALALLERQLVRRFGPLPKTVKSRLSKASEAQLDAWSEALLEAQSLRQVFK